MVCWNRRVQVTIKNEHITVSGGFMIETTIVQSTRKQTLVEFLIEKDFIVQELENNIISVKRGDELQVYISVNAGQLFFEMDLGNIEDIADKELYFKLLDLNTEILPVSLGIDSSNADDPHLVLLESRAIDNLDDNEVLSVLDTMEIAVEKVEQLLGNLIKA